MTTRGHSKRVYSLDVFEARDIRKASPALALYVRPILSGNKFERTEVKRNSTPAWEYTCSLTAELSSVLSLHLKHSRWPCLPAELGSVHIKIEELLDRCKNDQRATLGLRDKRGREAGSLIVQLRETTAHAFEAAVENATYDVDQGLLDLPPIPQPVQNVVDSTATVRNLGVVSLLKQVVEKTKVVVDLVDKTAKLHPYANIAWQILSSAYQAVQGQTERDDALLSLVDSMADLYSFVDDVDELENKIKSLERVIIRISVQMTECGIFIKQFVSHGFAGRLVRQPFSNTSQTISNLSQALKQLGGELQLGVTSHTAFVSAQISRDVEKLAQTEALKTLSPAAMDAGNRDTCLPGTRADILENLINSLIDPSGHNIIWFRGPAGSGKSTILTSVAQYFSELGRRGSFLFWDRNDPVNSDPVRVIRTLAFQLGCFKPEICAKLSVQIENSSHTSPLDTQFKHLLEEPLAELAKESDLAPIVIILDALDECGAVGTRRNLLRTLSEGLARLPSMFRFLIASRDELDINAALSHPGVDVRDAPIGDESTSSDIRLLFQQRLASNAHAFVKHHLPSDWPTEPVIEQLVTLSGGLFIWASTTILFIESGSPKERLDKVLSGSGDGPSDTRLHKLYRVALAHPFKSYNESELTDVHSILGVIVVARERLTDEQLSQLLGLGIRKVQAILLGLQPLLQGGYGRPIQVLHASFTDFLCDVRRREDSRWYIHPSTHHLDLSSGCLRIMQRDLKFNICGIETSHFRNKEIEGLQERINQAITPGLMYASQYWVDHLEFGSVSGPGSHPLADTIMDFFLHRFLYWVEVFSVTDRMSMLYVILRRLVSWATNHARGLEEIISEAHRFINAFGYPISQSLPHIYLSALPFSPSQSPILRYVHNAFRNTLSIRGRISNQWPAIHQTIRGHSDSVTSVAFSPDGTRIISGSGDKTVRIWDAVSGLPIGEPLKGHSDSVRSVAFSSDGTHVVSGSDDKTVQIWDAVSGAPIGEPLEGHSGPVTSVAFSSDGTQIISGSEDNTVQIWDAVSRVQIGGALEGHSDSVRSVAFSSNDTHIVSGSSDKTIRIWDSMSGVPIGEPLQGHFDLVRSVAFSPDCTQIISGSSDKTVRIWDAASGVPLGEPLEGHSDCVTSVAFSSDGTCIISGSDDKTVRIWDAMLGVPISEPLVGHARSVTSVTYSSDLTRIISASDDKTIRIWDAISGAPISEPLQGHSGSVTSVAYSLDSTHIISGSSDKTVRMWEAMTGVPIGKPLEGHSHIVTSVAFSSDGTHIISGSFDKTVRIWDAKLGEQIGKPLVGHTHSITSVAYSPNGTHIISGSFDKTVRIWDAESGAQIGRPLQGHTHSVTSVAYSYNGTHIISGSSDMTIRIWDAKSGAPIGEPLQGHSRSVASIAVSFDGTYIISGSDDKTVRIWDARSGVPIGEPLQGHSGSVRSVAFSPDGTFIISGASDRTVRIWDAKSGAPIGEPLQGHSDWVTSVAFSPNGTCIVSGSFDKRVRIWALMDELVQSSPVLAGIANWSGVVHNGAPKFSGGLLHDNGWATTTNGLLLFWVPPEHHFGLCWPHTHMVIGAQPTHLNMQCFVHGLQWMQCHTGGH